MAGSDRSIFSVTFRPSASLLIMKFLALVLLPGLAVCQSLPDAPEAKPHKFLDRPAVIAMSSSLALTAADASWTCSTLGVHKVPTGPTIQVGPGRFVNPNNVIAVGRSEALSPFKSCPAIPISEFGYLGAADLASYFLHRSGHHKLERAAQWLPAASAITGLVYTALHR